MIDHATISRILDLAQIEDVIGEFVHLRKAGSNYKGLCPFHDEKTPSFVVSPSKKLCKCFGCGKGGNVIHFLMEHEQLNYYEALKWLAAKYHVECTEYQVSPKEKEVRSLRESLFVMNEFARDYFRTCLRHHADNPETGSDYLHRRGFRDDIIRKFQVGYCPNQPDTLWNAAGKKGYKEELLLQTGLCYKRSDNEILQDRFSGRVIFPIHTLSGKIVGFGGRLTQANSQTAKYINSPESEIYHKSNELYGIYFAKQAIVKTDRCILVEGYTDVLAMHQCGIENVVASCGTSLTTEQIRLIHRFTDNITILYDGDRAGIQASLRGIDLLLQEGMNVKVVRLPDGDDPDSFSRKYIATDVQNYIRMHEVDFIRFKADFLLKGAADTPIDRANAISSILNSIAMIPDNLVRLLYINECSRLLQIEERLMMDKLNEIGRKNAYRSTQAYSQNRPAAYTPIEQQSKSIMYRKEAALVQIIIQYGERTISIFPDKSAICDSSRQEESTTVIDYIHSELAADKLKFHDELHREILIEAINHIHDENFVAQVYYLSHPTPQISRLAAEVLCEQYPISKTHVKSMIESQKKTHLQTAVYRLVIDFKLAYLEKELNDIHRYLLSPNVSADTVLYSKWITRYKNLIDVRQSLINQLSDIQHIHHIS